mmetsp:Transcript_6959/g.20581  ORF Transcript_6959/g.20581 Transcript_6959/m.20581 type:complete len:223 (+) Transcript_6959:56-724(+)
MLTTKLEGGGARRCTLGAMVAISLAVSVPLTQTRVRRTEKDTSPDTGRLLALAVVLEEGLVHFDEALFQERSHPLLLLLVEQGEARARYLPRDNERRLQGLGHVVLLALVHELGQNLSPVCKVLIVHVFTINVILVHLIEVKLLLVLLDGEHERRPFQLKPLLLEQILGDVEELVDVFFALDCVKPFLLVFRCCQDDGNVHRMGKRVALAFNVDCALHVAPD